MDTLGLLASLVNNPDVEIQMPHLNTDTEATTQRVTNFVTSMNRFNFSVRGLKDILNESNEYEKFFRTHSIIRDGELEVKSLDIRIRNYQVFKKYYKEKALFTKDLDGQLHQVEMLESFDDNQIYTLSLEREDIVGKEWLDIVKNLLVSYVATAETLYEYRRALKKTERDVRKSLEVGHDTVAGDTVPRLIDRDEVKMEDIPQGMKTISCVEYRLKSESLKESIEKKCSVTSIENLHYSHDELRDAISHTDEHLNWVRFMLRSTALALEVHGDTIFEWSEKKKLPRSKSKFIETTLLGDGSGILEKITYDLEVPI